MNKYKVIVRGSDAIGFSFLQNVLALSKKGAELSGVPHMIFPYAAEMIYETPKRQENTAFYTFYPIREVFSARELADKNIKELREIGSAWGVKDSSKEALIKKIVKASREDDASRLEESTLEEAVEENAQQATKNDSQEVVATQEA